MAAFNETPSGRREVISCHSEWIFDLGRKRFVRLPRGGIERERQHFSGENWNSYVDLVFVPDSPQFVVVLNEARTHMLRAWCHEDPCPRCGANVEGNLTTEISAVPARDRV